MTARDDRSGVTAQHTGPDGVDPAEGEIGQIADRT